MAADEDLQVLCTPQAQSGRSRRHAIVAGVLHFLKTWPGSVRPDLFGALLVACLISVAFVVLAVLPMIIVNGPHTYDICHQHRKTGIVFSSNRIMNVYFIKHENRTWTSEEFCYMETAARRYPQYNILIINLLNKEILENEREFIANYFDEILAEYISSEVKLSNNYKNLNGLESKQRHALFELPNVRNIDVGVKIFFARSILLKKIESLSSHKIELAAKFQVIWDSSGIALEPLAVHQLEVVGRFMNKNEIDTVASVQIDNDLQATSVPCQTFYGFVVSWMAKNSFTDRQNLLKHVLMDFCPSSSKCPGVRIVKSISKSIPNSLICPIILPFMNVNDK